MAKPLEQQTPAELIAYIKGLRTEIQEVREDAEQYSKVFERLDPAEQRGLLHIISLFVDDPKEGATMMADLAASVLGTDLDPQETTPKEDTTMADNNDSEAPAWLNQLIGALDQRFGAIEQQLAGSAAAGEDAEIRAYKAYAKGLGFVEGTPEFYRFFEIAASGLAGDGDLDLAFELYEKLEGPLHPEEEDEAAEEEAPASVPKERAEFPKTAKAPAANTTVQGEEEPTDFSEAAVRARALSWIEAATANPLAGA